MQPVTGRRWDERGTLPEAATVRTLAETLRIHPLTAALLARRGLAAPDPARAFLEPRLQDLPDPFLLPGMSAAAGRLASALAAGERISVHGDYDVDGMSATALLVEGLRACGAAAVDFFIPLRLRDGYGLCGDDLRRAAAGGATVAVSVDCGTAAHEEASLARALGLDLIITDHHQPPERLPEACALVNPHLPGCAYPDRDLAGVGVAFMLLIALRNRLRASGWFAARPEPDLRFGLDLVALGTIADVVPLRGVNRILTRIGLGVLNQGRRPGLAALCEVAGIRQATCGNVAFSLAPRLNAAGRLEDAALGVELLLKSDAASARSVAQRLDDCNRERQAVEQQVLAEAILRVETGEAGDCSIVLAGQGWHPGVIGIVASRLVERYHRPTVLVALDEEGGGKGSARSIRGLHLYQTLHGCRGQLRGYGGHAMAAGLTLDGAGVADFAGAFEAAARAQLAAEDLVATTAYDGEVLIE